MKILVISKKIIKKQSEDFFYVNNIINIRSSYGYYDLPISNSVIRLVFDDVTEKEKDNSYIKFSEKHAQKIFDFITNMDKSKDLYVNCDAGISRSGAVGLCLNEYFNKYLEDNKEDYTFFIQENYQISPNPLVKRILMNKLFGEPQFI
ncbi:MAG: dual specificity protein phosphatase family protein [Treponema sp.]|nr:dual specificity protein phosphatase family protein [Treponema sp.]